MKTAMSKFVSALVLALLIFSVVVYVSEAALTGTITGLILDSQGKPLPNVLISVQGTGLPGERTDYSREDGRYRLVLLPPGKYVIKAELPGFQSLRKKNVVVKINETARVNLKLEVSALEEVVVVTAEAPVIDTKTTSVGVNINREFTERLPSSDQFQEAFAMGGGTTSGGNPFVHGATHVDNLYLFDGVDATDPVTHTFASNLNADAVEEVEVQTGGFAAEYGKAMGGIVNAVTKTGGNKFEGILRFKYSTDSFTAPHDPGKTRSTQDDHYEPTLSLGGPIMRDHLWFFLSYRRSIYENTIFARTWRDPETLEFETTELDSNQLWQYWVGKVTWSASAAHNFEFSFSSDPVLNENQGGEAATPEAQHKYEQGGERYGLSWTYIYSSNLYLDTRYGYFNSYIYFKPMNDSGLAHVYDRQAKIHYNNYEKIEENDRSKNSFSTKGTLVIDDWAGVHEFKSGFEYQFLQERHYFNYTTGVSYKIDWYGTDKERGYRRYNVVDPKPDKNKGHIYSFFLQDGWEYQPGLTFNVGLRWDQAGYENKLGQEVHTFTGMIAPRFGVSWDVNNDGKSKVYFSTGRYYNTYDLTIVMAKPGPTSLEQEWWYDPDNPDADEEGYYLKTTSGGDISHDLIDSALKPEYTDEIILGYDREIVTNWALGSRVVFRQTRDIIEDVGFWGPDEAGRIHLATDVDITDQTAVDHWYEMVDQQGEYRYYFTNPDDAYRDYYGLELHSSARTEKMSLEISYTYSRAHGTNTNQQPGDYFASVMQHFTVYYDTPILCQNIDGPLYFDVPHYLKIYLSYNLPLGFVFGTHAWWKSGYIYEKLGAQLPGPDGELNTEDDVHHEDPAYGDDVTLPEGRGAYRLPDVVMVDLSIQKDFDFGKWGLLTAIIDINNFLNNQLNLAREHVKALDNCRILLKLFIPAT
ncbi:TonB-dependent receptor domain-containing protein, partial [candidate division CSSED10-310 bacterium]